MDAALASPADRLIRSCRSGSVIAVRRLLAAHPDILADQVAEPITRLTPLAISVEQGNFELAEMLLDSGAEDPGISRDADGNTVMHIACRTGRTDLLELYHCFYDTVLDWQNLLGLTPLALASKAGDETMTKVLIDLGADIDLPDLQGDTPLHYASSYGHQSVIRLLIERGANFQSKNERGWLPVDYAYSVPVMNFFNEAVRQVFEQNKRERSRRHAAKQAARAQAEAQRVEMPVHQRTSSSASKRNAGIIATSGGNILQLPGSSSAADVAASMKHKASSSTLPSSSSSIMTYGTSGVSSGGPNTPPASRTHLPPPIVSGLETPTSPPLDTTALKNSPKPEVSRTRSTSGGQDSPLHPDAVRSESGSPLRSRQGSYEASVPPVPPFQLSKSAILSAQNAAGRR